ncbi:hypothetical protein FISHEDRAFT_72777 [Fistulina hepatica ATCC 64428]|nr:hypothetical protein FISHEDRAFT_72777 [Fistulina hepatica ATCC 64428]
MGNNDPSRGHANESSWVEKLKVILPGGHSARGGWTQTPGGDEWEDRSDDGSYHLSEPQSGRPVSYVSQDPPFSPPMQASDSSQTVRLEAFHPSDAGVDRTASLNVESPSHPERTIMREPPATYQQNQKPPSPPLIGAFRRENSDAYEEAMPTQIFQSQPPRRPNFPVRPQSAIIEEATVSEPETESPKASMDKTIPAFEGGTKFVESLS